MLKSGLKTKNSNVYIMISDKHLHGFKSQWFFYETMIKKIRNPREAVESGTGASTAGITAEGIHSGRTDKQSVPLLQ